MKKMVIPVKTFNRSVNKCCAPGKRFIKSFIKDYIKDGNVVMTQTQGLKILREFIKFYTDNKGLHNYNIEIHTRVFLTDVLFDFGDYLGAECDASFMWDNEPVEIVRNFFSDLKQFGE